MADDSILVPSALNVAAGAWLACSPYALGLALDELVARQLGGGMLIFVLACPRATRAARTPRLSWAVLALALWLFASALHADSTDLAAANAAIASAVVCVLALISALTARG